MFNGVYYYFGNDGYMLADTWTPDGYYVDHNGAWVQGLVGEKTETQNVTSMFENKTERGDAFDCCLIYSCCQNISNLI